MRNVIKLTFTRQCFHHFAIVQWPGRLMFLKWCASWSGLNLFSRTWYSSLFSVVLFKFNIVKIKQTEKRNECLLLYFQRQSKIWKCINVLTVDVGNMWLLHGWAILAPVPTALNIWVLVPPLWSADPLKCLAFLWMPGLSKLCSAISDKWVVHVSSKGQAAVRVAHLWKRKWNCVPKIAKHRPSE